MTHELSQRALKNSLLPISTRRRTKNISGQQPTINKQMSMDGYLINNDQQKFLFPLTPLSLPISRQGSLDSRIEEILENNTMKNNGNDQSSNNHSDLNINVPKIMKE
jgi:hypothetical protein